MDSQFLARVSSNLVKLSVLLGVVAVALAFSGWRLLPAETDASGLWTVRIGAILVGYSSLKVFAIDRYLGSHT